MRLRAVLSFPIRSTSARPNISPRSASRRSPAPAPAWPSSAGKGDGAVDRAYTLSHLRDLAEATDLPLNADFEAGFARDAEGVHESARLCVGAGVSGLSIEDYTGNPGAPLYSVD